MRSLLRRGKGSARVAAITVVRDEAAMLPRWVQYYGDQLGLDNLLVVDDGSTDGSTDALPCRVLRHSFPKGRFEVARMALASRLAAEELRSHDAVLFADADEFLLADPARYDGLRDFVARRPDLEVAAGLGLNVLHHLDREPPLDAALPILGQRQYAKFVSKICKPSLKRIDAAWAQASHGIRAPYLPERDLLMVHLKFADLELLRRTADLRHAVREEAGLTEKSAWAQSGSEIAAQFRSFLPDDADVSEFDAASIDLEGLVTSRNGVWMATGPRQLRAMTVGPLVRIPARFHGMI